MKICLIITEIYIFVTTYNHQKKRDKMRIESEHDSDVELEPYLYDCNSKLIVMILDDSEYMEVDLNKEKATQLRDELTRLINEME